MNILVLTQLLQCNISIRTNCSTALKQYSKCNSDNTIATDIIEAQVQKYCKAFHLIKKQNSKCSLCDAYMTKQEQINKNLSSITKFNSDFNENFYDSMWAQNNYQYNQDPLMVLLNVYQSVDLREGGLVTPSKNQKMIQTGAIDNGKNIYCGGSWAFVVNTMLENSILIDNAQQNYKNLSPWDELTAATLNLSEQWLLVNVLANESAQTNCLVGDVVTALTYLSTNMIKFPPPSICIVNQNMGPPTEQPCAVQAPTVELASNYPNNWTLLVDQIVNVSGPLPPLLPLQSFLFPFKILEDQGFPLPVVGIFYDSADGASFDADAIQRIRSYLSRGIAVAGKMWLPNADCIRQPLTLDDCDNNTPMWFQQYQGQTVLTQACPTYQANHYVTFIGYGKKNGKNVWLVKNSWGPTWGSRGSFFVPVGSNDFCIEQYAFAIIPKFYNLSYDNVSQDVGQQFHRIRGPTDLEKDEGNLMPNVVSPLVEFFTTNVIIALSTIGAIILVFILDCICNRINGCCKKERKAKQIQVDDETIVETK